MVEILGKTFKCLQCEAEHEPSKLNEEGLCRKCEDYNIVIAPYVEMVQGLSSALRLMAVDLLKARQAPEGGILQAYEPTDTEIKATCMEYMQRREHDH